MSYPQPTYYGQPPQPSAPRKHRRVHLWVFLVVQALFLIWIIAGANSAQHANNCSQQGQLQNLCHQATDTGTAIGIMLIIFLWAAVDVIWGVTYLIVRANRRPR